MDIVEVALMAIGYTVLFCIFLFGLAFAYILGSTIYKVYVKKETKYKVVDPSELTEEQKKEILEKLAEDDSNWINLHVEKSGDMIYFYDGDDPDTAKFLFQCTTYDEMVENLQKIRGHKGVRIRPDLVEKLQMQDFFLKPGVKLVQRKIK